MSHLALLVLPALAAGLALLTGRLSFKLGVPGLCALILVSFLRGSPPARRREIWAMVAAFGMSMVGDYFLSNRSGHAHYFEAGIAAFFVAHLGYLRYALLNGSLHRLALALLLAVFLPYFGLALSPVITSRVLQVAVFSYLLISCVSFAAAMGWKQSAWVKGFYLFGIGLMVFSDTIISFNEFLRYRGLNGLILPTYYAAQLAITASLLLRRDLRGGREEVGNPEIRFPKTEIGKKSETMKTHNQTMKTTLLILSCGLFAAASIQAGEGPQATLDVVKPRVSDQLLRVTLNQQELGGEIDRRIRNLVYSNYMVLDVDGKWLNYFRDRTDRGGASHVYYGIGKVIDAGSLFAAYTGDPKVAARTQYLIDELVKSRDADGYLGFWKVEPKNRQDHINWILHEQEYINLAFVRNYRCTGNPQSLAHAKIMGDYILKTFPTPQNPCFDPGEICTAGLPEGMLELYRVTGDQRYFDFAADVPHGNNRGEVQLASLRTWEQDFSRRPCHVYVMLARCYAQTELYRLTGEENLLHMSQFMRNEMLKQGEGGMLVTGSCSEGEHFTYNQNGRGDIGESCVTAYVLRWMDSLLRLEGDLRYGDLLERTMYNALFAANSPDGRWIRYFTPFTGDRQYDTRDSFCCCGNYRRAVAELPEKVYYRTPEGGIALNLFANSKKAFEVKGQTVTLLQETAYPNDGEVKLTFSTPNPVAFAFQFRTPRWCEKITLRVNNEAPVTIDSARQKLGCYVLNRTWQDGDVARISMPMTWRFLRGRAVQDGRVALLRGPMVYGIGKDQNAALLAKCPEPRNLVIDPASIAAPAKDNSIRPDGLKAVAKAWLNQDRTGEQVAVTLTEFPDPSGRDVYFRVPNLADTSPVRLADDEIVSWPNEFVNAHVLKAVYGPKATGDVAALFEIRGDVLTDLAVDYVNPSGKTGVKAEMPDGTGGRWAFYNCKNGGLLSTAATGEVKLLNSQFKAFGSPLGYAPSDRQEAAWQNHYTEGMFDQVLSAAERKQFLYTHPISDTASYNVFRWTPSADARTKDVTMCGKMFSNLGNGVELRVIRWNDDTRREVLGTFNTKDLTVGKCGTAEFVLRLPPGAAGQHLDFVLHNAGSHVSDATALSIRAYTNVQQAAAQTDVTDKVQAKFRSHLVTPLGPYSGLFGEVAPGEEKTLKVKVNYWREGVVKYHEFPQNSALDLTGK